MKALFVDTSSNKAHIALFQGVKLDKELNFSMGLLSDNDFFVKIIEFLEEEKIEISSLNYLALGIGPGSYTGMRKSASVLSAWCYACDKPLITLSSLDGYLPSAEGRFIAVTSAKRGRFFCRIGKRGETVIWEREPLLLTMAQLSPFIDKDTTIVSPDLEEIKPFFLKEGCYFEEVAFNLKEVVKMCDIKYLNKQFSLIDPIELLYLQEPFVVVL